MEKQKNKKNNAAKRNQASNIPKIKKRRNKVVAIGDQKLVRVRFINKKPHINIRAYSRDEHGRMFSTKRGIMLTLEEWNRLKSQMTDIDLQV